MEKILISACLAGHRVRYDGKQAEVTHALLMDLGRRGRLVAVCPEVSGGMKIPRPPAQIVHGNGLDVLSGKANVVDITGRDVTPDFVRGAEYALSMARRNRIGMAILKEKSPSCGVNRIYDGHFTATLMPGTGVTTALLKLNGIQVFSENELDQVAALLAAK